MDGCPYPGPTLNERLVSTTYFVQIFKWPSLIGLVILFIVLAMAKCLYSAYLPSPVCPALPAVRRWSGLV